MTPDEPTTPDEEYDRPCFRVSLEYEFLDVSPESAALTFVDIIEDPQQCLDLTLFVRDDNGLEYEFPYIARAYRHAKGS